jgi:hypothetical protein
MEFRIGIGGSEWLMPNTSTMSSNCSRLLVEAESLELKRSGIDRGDSKFVKPEVTIGNPRQRRL